MNITKVDNYFRRIFSFNIGWGNYGSNENSSKSFWLANDSALRSALRNRLCASEQPSAIRYTNDSCRLVTVPWMKDYLRQRRYSYPPCTVQTRDTLNYRYTISYSSRSEKTFGIRNKLRTTLSWTIK